MLGVHFGAVTNTPGLGATQEALDMLGYKGENIAIAYACAYPLGVVGIIATAVILRKMFRINLKEEDRHWEEEASANSDAPIFFHVAVTNAGINGQAMRTIRDFIGRPFICSRVLHDGVITSPSPDTQVFVGDKLRIVAGAESKAAIVAFFGQEEKDIDLAMAHSPLIARNILISKDQVNGMRLGELHLSRYDGVNITRVFRAGMTLFPYQNLHLQMGDQVYCVGPQRSIERLADRLGNQVQKLDHPNIISIFWALCWVSCWAFFRSRFPVCPCRFDSVLPAGL